MLLSIIVACVLFAVAALLGYLCIPFVVRAAVRLKLYDLPNSRKVHDMPVPRLGGLSFLPVVVVVLCIGVICILRMSRRNVDLWTSASVQHFLAYLSGVVLLYGVGVYDDLLGVGYKKKFAVQIVAAALLCVGGLWIATFDNILGLGSIPFWVGMSLTMLFVVYVTNAINLIDGIDGLASGLAAISLFVIGVVNLLSGSLFWAFVAVVWLGVVCAFYIYNVYGRKNKIFMGDAGSLTLGYTISFLVLHFWQLQPIVCNYIDKSNMIVMSTLIIPLFDVVRVFASRVRDGRSPFLPDKNHIHHKLLRTGMTKHAARECLLALAASFILMNYFIALKLSETLMVVADVVVYVAMQYCINFFIARREKKWA